MNKQVNIVNRFQVKSVLIHTPIIYHCLSYTELQEGWSLSQLSLGERQGTMWAVHQLSIYLDLTHY